MDFIDSSFTKAVRSFVERIGQTLPFGLPEPVRLYLVGGSAMGFYVNERVSNDVDGIFSHRILLSPEMTEIWQDERQEPRLLTMGTNFSEALALVHPDYKEDSLLVGEFASGRLLLHLLSPVDLAVTKIGRFSEVDRQDLCRLAEWVGLDPEAVESRAKEALSHYIGQVKTIETHIELAKGIIEECGKPSSGPGY